MSLKRALLISFVAVLFALGAGAGAQAQENPDYTAPAPTVPVTETAIQTVAAPTAARSAAAPLAITGTDAMQLVVAGSVLVACGAGVLFARRRSAA